MVFGFAQAIPRERSKPPTRAQLARARSWRNCYFALEPTQRLVLSGGVEFGAGIRIRAAILGPILDPTLLCTRCGLFVTS